MKTFNLLPFNDKLKEECGVFGISNHSDAAAHTILGLHALQHRGQEAAGIVTFDGINFHNYKAQGLVGDNFSNNSVLSSLVGNYAIGHVRYSTTGGNEIRNVQPIFAEFSFGGVAIAHNGNLTNAASLRKQLIAQGCIFHSAMDTEILIHLIATRPHNDFIIRLIESLKLVKGAYSLVLLTAHCLLGIRDPFGVRPLVLGKIKNSYVLASETCAFDIIGAEYIRDVEPGEIVIINNDGSIKSLKPFEQVQQRFCIFEYIYFSRPDSKLENKDVYKIRKQIGAELAKEAKVQADLVVPVPDSGVASALGYAEYSKIPFELGIIRNHYIGRTFIEPTETVRHLGVKLKHNANKELLKGKKIILIDDSIVRGTTSRKIVEMVRAAGATEVHMRIASPPTAFSCFYGVDTPNKKDLLAANSSVDEIAKFINVDSLAFLSIDALYFAIEQSKRNNSYPQYCDACFTGDYPIELTDSNNCT
ncbi:Amidophosphoribosyltransferase precursor [Rickettsiales bacterium Ac37b]|nr:Amidophosphoribosyltransferase precursor [Rickettsiales bacterium Ac37b]